MPAQPQTVRVTINGIQYQREVAPRRLLTDFLREDLGLMATHVGCEHGACGACTIIMNGLPVRSCLTLAVQADGAELMTLEGLAAKDGQLHPLQEAFWDHHALQCGYCTPGMLMAAYSLLQENPDPTELEVREALSGNICRCTGYVQIVQAVLDAASRITGKPSRAAANAVPGTVAPGAAARAAAEKRVGEII